MGSERAWILPLCCLALTAGACRGDPKPSQGERAKTPAGEATQAEVLPEGPGALASGECDYAMAVLDRLDIYRGVEWPLDARKPPEIISRARDGASVLDWLAHSDLALGRVVAGEPRDVALINELLERMPEREQDGLRVDLTHIVTRLRTVALLEMRRLLTEVADGRLSGAAAEGAWDEAYCLWDGGLRKLAARSDALPLRGGEDWEASIDEAFTSSREGLDHPVEVKVARQKIEKAMYAVNYQLVLALAESQTATGASEALGLVEALEDRVADRNGPGLERLRAQLEGDPSKIDAALIERELAVAFTKRARKYCDKAVSSGELGTPDAIAETWEGIIYTRVILPGMGEALTPAGFDADTYSANWHSYLGAVSEGDAAAAGGLSAGLVEWNCAYQEHLGLAECGSATNESE